MRSKQKCLIILISMVVFASCSQSSEKKIEEELESPDTTEHVIFHASHEPNKKDAPFSDVVEVQSSGAIFFLSGQIGMDHTTRTLVDGGVKAETTQTLENIRDVLAQHDLELRDVVKATVILNDISDFAAFNEIYTSYFPQKPARTTFAAEALARGAKIEIEVVAVKR